MPATISNEDRAFRAQQALDFYASLPDNDPDESMQDLLTDLIHLAKQEGINFEKTLRMARFNAEAEHEEEADK